MPRTGQRPHCWKVQGEVPHKQYLAFLQMRAQANYRKEQFELTFEQFQQLWQLHWDQKGRAIDQYCLTRINEEGEWSLANTQCIRRLDHLRRKNQQRAKNRSMV